MLPIPLFKPGQRKIREALNSLVRVHNAIVNMTVAGGLQVSIDDAAIVIVAPPCSGMWIRITGAAGTAYSWEEVVRDDSGGWETQGESGTTSDDPAREANDYTGVTVGTIVRATRHPQSGEVLFEISNCDL